MSQYLVLQVTINGIKFLDVAETRIKSLDKKGCQTRIIELKWSSGSNNKDNY